MPYLAALALSIWLVSLAMSAAGSLAATGYVVPVAMFAAFVGQGSGRVGRRGLWALAAATAALLAVPWVVLAAQRLGVAQFLEGVDREVLQGRVTEVGTSNRGPIWTYAAEFTLTTLPWALFLPVAFLQVLRTSGKHVLAHERVFFRKLLFQNAPVQHVVRISLREILPRVDAPVRRHARRAREDLRDPAFLHPASDHLEKHEMRDLVVKHLEKHRGAVEMVNENPSLPLDELALRLAPEKPVAEKPACGVFRQIRDLAQAFQVETREQIDRAHDVVDRNDVLPGETRQQEIQLASARRFSRGGPILDEQAHFRLS